MQLPPDMRMALEAAVSGCGASGVLTAAAGDVSNRYRRIGETGGSLQIRSAAEAASYLAVRFPATFCAATAAFRQIEQVLPGFSPASVLDAGAGPATATLAASYIWPALRHAELLEPNEHLRAAGSGLLSRVRPDVRAEWAHDRLGAGPTAHGNGGRHDLAVMGYMLNEIEQELGVAAVDRAVATIWARTAEVLVIVEPGTPFGQRAVLRARDWLLQNGAQVAAPCPHEGVCPIAAARAEAERWCHFSVRVERSKLHRRIKSGADAPYEDETYAYLIVTRHAPARVQNRLIGMPRGSKVVDAELCRADGKVVRVAVAKSSPDYKHLRGAAWGDGW